MSPVLGPWVFALCGLFHLEALVLWGQGAQVTILGLGSREQVSFYLLGKQEDPRPLAPLVVQMRSVWGAGHENVQERVQPN